MVHEPESFRDELQAMQQRLDLLDNENQRLREKLEPFLGKDNPCFDSNLFLKAIRKITLLLLIPAWVMPLAFPLLMMPNSPIRPMTKARIGPIGIIDVAGSTTGIRGVGLGIIAVGGIACGIFALGGGSVGIIAVGGGAIG